MRFERTAFWRNRSCIDQRGRNTQDASFDYGGLAAEKRGRRLKLRPCVNRHGSLLESRENQDRAETSRAQNATDTHSTPPTVLTFSKAKSAMSGCGDQTRRGSSDSGFHLGV